MDKYLLEILKDVNTIIIPGLGALTITNADKGEIMFMSYLKHDDGKLTSYIAEKEGMDENEAKNLVAKYVREIQIELDKGESYDMYQFGSFYKNDGEPDFKSWATMHPSEENTPPPVVIEENKEDENILIPPTPVEAKEVEEIKEETLEVKEEPLPKEEVKLEEKQAAPVIATPKSTEEVKPKVENTYTPPKTEKKELNILEKEEKEATAAKLEKLRKEQEDQKKKKKRGAGFYVLIALIVLLIGSGTFFGLNYDEYKQHVPFLADNTPVEETSQLEQMEDLLNGEVEDETIEDQSEEFVNDETEETNEERSTEADQLEAVEETIDEAKEEVIEVMDNNTDGNLPFHVIAGAFSSEENANRLGEKLKAAGHQVRVGKGRGMNLVSVKAFATRAEAQSGLSNLKDVAPNGWIYEWK